MIWIRLLLTGLLSVGLTGSIAYVCTLLAPKLMGREEPYLLLAWQKFCIVLYWVPVPFAVLCLSRLRLGSDGYLQIWGEFATGMTPELYGLCRLAGIIWTVGFIGMALYFLWKELRVWWAVRGNVPVDETFYLRIFESYKESFRIDNVTLYWNDMLASPVTYSRGRGKHKEYFIVLPIEGERCPEKQFRIIVTHEIHHIINGSLKWRKFGLMTVLLHWFNPIAHLQLDQLICWDEILCDLQSCDSNTWYSRREYSECLAGFSDGGFVNAFTISLVGTKSQTIRRIMMMSKVKQLTKPSKWVIAVSCLALTAVALAPVSVAFAKSAELQETMVAAEEDDFLGGSDPSVETTGGIMAYDDGSVEEIELNPDIELYTDVVTLDNTIPADQRVLYHYRSMKAGDSITIASNCKDSSITYRIGIKNRDKNYIIYQDVSGLANYTFSISEDGVYSAFVENRSDVEMKVTGSATYFD
ncbi:MAG: M56 family metallopeptidase [Roseburia sp.]|nr:M56 family metallopeptidase [Roseburia sp.]